MRNVNEENERIKRDYLGYCRDALGEDRKTIDTKAAVLRDFELAMGVKPFKAFHIEWAARFKRHLENARNARTGKPLALTTRDARLRIVKGFVHWLASQQGFKSRISYADAEYFNNNAKDARAAHAERHIPYPSMEQCAHAFRLMPDGTEVERRDKAIFAFLMLTRCRDGAAASLRLKHIDLVDGHVFQDGREVKTKNSKTIDTWFFPVDAMYRDCFEGWVTYLREERLFGPDDALFPKSQIKAIDGRFTNTGLAWDTYANAQHIITTIKDAFVAAGLHPFTPHSFRKTLGRLGDEICLTREAWKAWTQNLGHSNPATTERAYLPVSRDRQRELFKGMS